ncbi:hypothetical protein [Spiroplasma endosymbiont of Aspidapion aeneum]|uniref:glycoside hydrolase family 38 N-terminal domain-containing protein n=1 Tax=Spiroplasma endosymbiont of Aspidapion aeneum TaxID=3066276 RepID=UPI00313C1E7F
MKKWKIYCVLQTHWDKEWYFQKTTSDMFLIDNFKKIIEVYERNKNEFNSFNYDGQYSVIDDYLEYFPNDFKKIREIANARKLICGPFYTQIDNFNSSGESILRNILIGTKSADNIKGNMKIAYMPDSFGFNGNLPQIFNKSEMNMFVHWRGLCNENLKKGSIYNWIGIDGSSILSYNLFDKGYSMGTLAIVDNEEMRFLYNKNNILEFAKKYLISVKKEILPNVKSKLVGTTNCILFPFGTDQFPMLDNFNELISLLNAIDDENEWISSNCEEYNNIIEKNIDKKSLGEFNGEMRFGEWTRTHRTIGSGRYDIKNAIKILEEKIYNVAEPLGLIYEKLGGTYPKNELIIFTKKLLSSLAHDSAGACNSDETNLDIIQRLKSATAGVEGIITLMKKRIFFEMDMKLNDVIAINLKPYNINMCLDLTIHTYMQNFEIKNTANNVLNYTILNQEFINDELFTIYSHEQVLKNKAIIDAKGWYKTQIKLHIGNVKGLEIVKLRIHEMKNEIRNTIKNKNFIENNYYRVSVTKEGKIDVYDKIIIKNIYKIPQKLHSDIFIRQEVKIIIFLNEKIVDMNIEMLNNANDIRWRIHYNTDFSPECSYSDTAFGVQKKPLSYEKYIKKWDKDNWNDYPASIESMESACFIKNNNNDNQTLSVYTLGQNDYELIGAKYSTLAINLFRAYSYLGQRNLKWRPGRSSGIKKYPHMLYDSNLNKYLKFKIGFELNNNINFVRSSKDWSHNGEYFHYQIINKNFTPGDSFMMSKKNLQKINSDILMDMNIDKRLVVSCFKKAHDKDKYIFRIYNPTNDYIIFKPLKEWTNVNVLENYVLNEDDNILRPNEFKTYMF